MAMITNKHPTQKLIGMDIREEDKQMVKPIGRRTDGAEEGWVVDRLINAPCNGRGKMRVKGLIKKNKKRHGGMEFIISNRSLFMKWKTITNPKFFIKCNYFKFFP